MRCFVQLLDNLITDTYSQSEHDEHRRSHRHPRGERLRQIRVGAFLPVRLSGLLSPFDERGGCMT
jgi:hypothetical protein